MSDEKLEDAKAFVRRALSRFPANALIDDATIEEAARKILKTFRFLDRPAADTAGPTRPEGRE